MSLRYWIAALALGLAFSFQALAQEQATEKSVDPSPAQEQSTNQSAIVAEPDFPEVATTEPPGAEPDESAAEDGMGYAAQHSYLVYGDGLAQWAMAITGVGAFVLSAWAVFLLRGTLHATREAVSAANDAVVETRRIGEAQVRAYVHADSVTISRGDGPFWTVISVKNTGLSPARWFEVAAKSELRQNDPNVFIEEINWGDLGKFRRWNALANDAPLTAPIISDAQDHIASALKTSSARIFIWGVVRYETIFDERFESQFAFQGNPFLMSKLATGETIELKRPMCILETYKRVKG